MSTVQYAGQFVIEKCELITSAGLTINLSSSILEINIFEDIYSNALKGSILCFDTNSLNVLILQTMYFQYIRLVQEMTHQQTLKYLNYLLCHLKH